jgi:uridine monophosphate synthetase
MIPAPLVDKESLITALHDIGVFQFKDYTTKSGELMPVYLDMHLLVNRPALLRRIARMIQSIVGDLSFDRLAAIPMAGLPIGVALSLISDVPLIYPRMQNNGAQPGRYIEGSYRTGETVLLVDDILASGEKMQTALKLLETVRLKTLDIVVVIDREAGGSALLRSRGYHVYPIITLHEALSTLLVLNRIPRERQKVITEWLVETYNPGSEHSRGIAAKG